MLTTKQLEHLGYTFAEDPDQPGKFIFKAPNGEGSDISYDLEGLAVLAAFNHALNTLDLHECDNCGAIHKWSALKDIKDLAERITPGGVSPSGECPDCAALCYPVVDDTNDDEPQWDEIRAFHGLDPSFQYSSEQMEEYRSLYAKHIKITERAVEMVKKIAAMKMWGEPDEDGKPFEPSDGLEDSHSALMELIEEARGITA